MSGSASSHDQTFVQRVVAAISDEDKSIGLVGYRLTDEQVEKIVRVVFAAARVAGHPDSLSNALDELLACAKLALISTGPNSGDGWRRSLEVAIARADVAGRPDEEQPRITDTMVEAAWTVLNGEPVEPEWEEAFVKKASLRAALEAALGAVASPLPAEDDA